jgi:hypothetical protein
MNRDQTTRLVWTALAVATVLIVLDIEREPWMLAVLAGGIILSVAVNYRDLRDHRTPSTQQRAKRLVAITLIAGGVGLWSASSVERYERVTVGSADRVMPGDATVWRRRTRTGHYVRAAAQAGRTRQLGRRNGRAAADLTPSVALSDLR